MLYEINLYRKMFKGCSVNKQILEYLNEGVIIFNQAYKILYCNKSILMHIKYNMDMLYKESIEKIIASSVQKLIIKGTEEVNLQLYNHAHQILEVRGSIFEDEWLGEKCYWLWIKEYNPKKVGMKEMEAILENMPYSIWIADAEDNYRYTNTNTFIMLKQLFLDDKLTHKDELLKEHPSKIYRGSLPKSIFKEDQETLQKGIMINEERRTEREEDGLKYRIIKIPLFNEMNEYEGYIGITQYEILKQKVDLVKELNQIDLEAITDRKILYSQLVQLLDINLKVDKLLQGKISIIMRYDKLTDKVEEIGRLDKSENKISSSYYLNINGKKLMKLIEHSAEWTLEDFEQAMDCDLHRLRKAGISYIRISPIEYNGEFMGTILTAYESKLKFPLMEACVIEEVCQQIATIFKGVEYAIGQRQQLLMRKEIEAESLSYKEALKLETLKTEFLANISHELKTPLNIIYSILQMFELELKELMKHNHVAYTYDKLIEYEEIAKQNIFRLLRLINNITDISKMGAGYYKAKMINSDIIKEIEDITMSVVAYLKNKEVSITFDTDVEELVMAYDPEKMERIMLNLFSNAVKYTNPGGEIEVQLKVKDSQLAILVKDTGIGIPKDKQQIIFERFTQVDSSFSRKCEGSGIGLALVKSLVEMQQGKITVESEEGKGSTFTVFLPIREIESLKQKRGLEAEKEEQLLYKCRVEFSDIYNL